MNVDQLVNPVRSRTLKELTTTVYVLCRKNILPLFINCGNALNSLTLEHNAFTPRKYSAPASLTSTTINVQSVSGHNVVQVASILKKTLRKRSMLQPEPPPRLLLLVLLPPPLLPLLLLLPSAKPQDRDQSTLPRFAQRQAPLKQTRQNTLNHAHTTYSGPPPKQTHDNYNFTTRSVAICVKTGTISSSKTASKSSFPRLRCKRAFMLQYSNPASASGAAVRDSA